MAIRPETAALPDALAQQVQDIDADLLPLAWEVWESPRPIKILNACRRVLLRARETEKFALARAKVAAIVGRRSGYSLHEVVVLVGLSKVAIVRTKSVEDALYQGMHKTERLELEIEGGYTLEPCGETTAWLRKRGNDLAKAQAGLDQATARAKVAAIVASHRKISQYLIAEEVGLSRRTIRLAMGKTS